MLMNPVKPLLAASLVLAAALCSLPALAQDSAFLACARFSDRGQRIACLEDALEAALPGAGANPDAAVSGSRPAPAAPRISGPAPAPQAPASASVPPAAVAPLADASAQGQEPASAEAAPSLLERLRNFGQESASTITSDEAGNDQLHDTITVLEKRNNLWLVTLASGQVWRQEVPRTLNLREGDTITIYQAGLGKGYRMATERLNGFIRVERLK